MMKPIFYSSLFLAMLSISACDSSSENDNEASFSDLNVTLLHEGQYLNSGEFTDKSSQSIRSQAMYETLLVDYSSDAPQTLNFDEGSVLLVDMGQKNTGGFDIEVESATESGSRVTVSVLLTEPGARCNVTTALTNPYQFVWIPSDKEQLINESLLTSTCD